MERKEELILIETAIAENDVQKLRDNCKTILKRRIGELNYYDLTVFNLINKIIASYTPQIELELISMKDSILKRQKCRKKDIYVIMIVTIIGILLCSYDSTTAEQAATLVRIIGGIIMSCVGFIISKMIAQNSKSAEYSVVRIKSTKEDIISDLDVTYNALSEILLHNQLEIVYSSLLQWIQLRWSESDNTGQEDIERVLRSINYELIDYSPGLGNYFEVAKSPNVNEPTTTIKAIKNKKSGDIVIRGCVLFPTNYISN